MGGDVNLDSLFGMEGRVALVTGASRGIGKAMARALAVAGADVAITGRDQTEIDAVLAEILTGTDSDGVGIATDLAGRGQGDRLAAAVIDRLGRVDVLVSNAGGNFPEPIAEVTDERWDEVLGTHLGAAMELTRALAPGMKERGWGRLIYISSILGFQGMSGRAAYTSSKAALLGLARSTAVELGPYGVTANCIAPGTFDTGALKWLDEEERRRVDGRAALERAAQPAEMMGPILLLASNAGSFISGSTLVVDGGWLAK